MSQIREMSEHDREIEALLQIEEGRHIQELPAYPELQEKLDILLQDITDLLIVPREPQERLTQMLSLWDQALNLLRLWAPSEIEFIQRLKRAVVLTNFSHMTEHYLTDAQRLTLVRALRSHLSDFAQIAQDYLENEQGTRSYETFAPRATKFLQQRIVTRQSIYSDFSPAESEDGGYYPDDDIPGNGLSNLGPFGLR